MYRQCRNITRLTQYAYKGLKASVSYRLHPITIPRSHLHLSAFRYAATDRSKVEYTLKMLKEDLQNQMDSDANKLKLVPVQEETKKLSIVQKIYQGARHYYHGFRLLALETRLGAKYLFRIMRGKALTRRERQQLVRTVSDLFRLVPFSIFIIVPCMELTLPLFIKLFPNMLPSTFQEKNDEEEKIGKQLKVRVEMAKFLQDTIEEIALERKNKLENKNGESKALEFARFIKKVRQEGGYVSNEELFKYSKLFEDELTLDNLSMSQLRALCKLLSIQPMGTPEILRFQLNMKLRELKADDKQIASEGGADSLSVQDLQAAVRARGMRALGLSQERLKDQLSKWLELSLNDKVPPSLLLLSRTMFLPEDISFTDRLKNILQNIPDGIAEQTRQKLTEMEGGQVDHKARIDLIRAIEDAILTEKNLAKQQAAEKAKEEAVKAEKTAEAEKEALALEQKVEEATPTVTLTQAAQAAHTAVEEVKEHLADLVKEVAAKKITSIEETKLGSKDLSSIENILHGGPILEAKHDIIGLKEKVIEHTEDLIEVGALDDAFAETKVARRLRSKLNSMIENVDSLVTKLEDEKRKVDETLSDPAVQDSASIKKERQVRITDLIESLQKLKKVTDDSKRARIEEVLIAIDEDKDGIIDADLVLEVISLMEKHSDVPISPKQMVSMIEMLKKEDQVEAVAKAMEQINLAEPILPQGPAEVPDEELKPNNGPLDVPEVQVPPTVQLKKDGTPKKTQEPHV